MNWLLQTLLSNTFNATDRQHVRLQLLLAGSAVTAEEVSSCVPLSCCGCCCLQELNTNIASMQSTPHTHQHLPVPSV
jgi:hypothetical protein